MTSTFSINYQLFDTICPFSGKTLDYYAYFALLSAMSEIHIEKELLLHLQETYALSQERAGHLVAEVFAFYRDSYDDYVRRRHHELQQTGMRNAAIFAAICQELPSRHFPGPKLTMRQVRRLIYG